MEPEVPEASAEPTDAAPTEEVEHRPMYWRVLRLHHIRPNGWLRALYLEGSIGLAVVLVLAEAASVWTIVALPVLVAVLVKANDVLVGALQAAGRDEPPSESAQETARPG
jgi:hypothetical protein